MLTECLGTLLSARDSSGIPGTCSRGRWGAQHIDDNTQMGSVARGPEKGVTSSIHSQDGFHKKVTFELILKDGNELVGHSMVWEQEGLPNRETSMCKIAEYGASLEAQWYKESA